VLLIEESPEQNIANSHLNEVY